MLCGEEENTNELAESNDCSIGVRAPRPIITRTLLFGQLLAEQLGEFAREHDSGIEANPVVIHKAIQPPVSVLQFIVLSTTRNAESTARNI
jgi:hypothetical protein